MKFEKNGMKFEVSNLDHIVINTVRRVIKPQGMDGSKRPIPARVTNEKERNLDLGTRVWFRYNVKHGIRWGKFEVQGEFNPEAIPNIREAEMYSSQDEMQQLIMNAMQRPDIDIWFSGTYCNIEICENYQEVQRIKAQAENRKRRARQPKIPRQSDIMDALRYAISSAGAHIEHENIDTPFGKIPVMTITGSGRRDLLRDVKELEKNGQFISLDDAAKLLKISRR